MLQELEQLEGKEAQAEASELPAVPKVIWLHTLCMRKWHLLPLIAFWVQDAALHTIECVEAAHAALSIDRAVVGCYLLRLSSLICPFVNACLDSPEHMQICCSSLCLLCCLQAELCRRRALQLSKEKTKLTGRCLASAICDEWYVSCRSRRCRQMHRSSRKRRPSCLKSCRMRPRSPLLRRLSSRKRRQLLRSAEQPHRSNRSQRDLCCGIKRVVIIHRMTGYIGFNKQTDMYIRVCFRAEA